MALLQAQVCGCFFHADRIEQNLQSTARSSTPRESDSEKPRFPTEKEFIPTPEAEILNEELHGIIRVRKRLGGSRFSSSVTDVWEIRRGLSSMTIALM